MILNENYKVVIVDEDFYARNAINSYLAWDRRTRVMKRLANLAALTDYLSDVPESELPDTILLDSALLRTPEDTQSAILHIHDLCSADILVLAARNDADIADAVFQAGAQGYLNREDVGLQIAWLIGWAKGQEFVTTPSTALYFEEPAILPNGKEYPELTDRVRQALMLCVVEGMSADLAADEMGLSPHTIRTYIKEGYSILEAANSDLEYPAELSPQEKAFMRFTALTFQNVKLDDETVEQIDDLTDHLLDLAADDIDDKET